MNVDYDQGSRSLTLLAEQRSSEVQFHMERLPIDSGDASRATIFAGYRRCSDFDAGNNAGQDYIVVRGDGNTIVGVVADGVGQSFYGDLAGRRVADYMHGFLWERRSNPPVEEEVARALQAEAAEFKSVV